MGDFPEHRWVLVTASHMEHTAGVTVSLFLTANAGGAWTYPGGTDSPISEFNGSRSVHLCVFVCM